jgi:hypothetical protein
MGKLSYDHRITLRTSADVVERLGVAVARMQRLALKFGGRKLGIEGLVGAVILDFLSRTEAEQRAILGVRLPELEAQLGLGKDEPASPPADPSPDRIVTELRSPVLKPKTARNRKQG